MSDNEQIDWDQWENVAAKRNQRDASYYARIAFLKRGGTIKRVNTDDKGHSSITSCPFFRTGIGASPVWHFPKAGEPAYMPMPSEIVKEYHQTHISRARWARKPPQRVAPTPIE